MCVRLCGSSTAGGHGVNRPTLLQLLASPLTGSPAQNDTSEPAREAFGERHRSGNVAIGYILLPTARNDNRCEFARCGGGAMDASALSLRSARSLAIRVMSRYTHRTMCHQRGTCKVFTVSWPDVGCPCRTIGDYSACLAPLVQVTAPIDNTGGDTGLVELRWLMRRDAA